MRLAWVLVLFAGYAADAMGHGEGTRGKHVFDWHNDTVSRVVAPSYAWNNLGTTLITAAGDTVDVDGKACMGSPALEVDVDDAYAFDIDESVTLSVQLAEGTSADSLTVFYDKVGGPGSITVSLDADRQSVAVELADARFANRGDFATDLLLVGLDTTAEPALPGNAALVVCDIEVERSLATRYPSANGWLDLSIRDEDGSATTARVGLYDDRGKLPLVGPDAVVVREFADLTRTYLIQSSAVWPADNRYVFYVDGAYRARVPVGKYRLVVTKGIEYRFADRTVEIEAGETAVETVQLERHVDQPANGWYSGDVHVHNLRRDGSDNAALLAHTSAEDVHVANILEMGNVAGTHFPQSGWGEAGRFARGEHAVVAGQEDPRTLTLGHTIHLNIDEPIRFPDDYLSYRRVFEAVADQRGLSGFAHAGGGLEGTTEGMTMQAAFGLLDFGEVMQGGEIGTDVWFALLNLGYRMVPAAGTDYPYLDHPGAVRSYVKSDGGQAIDAWFAGLGAGRTFVTNGPLVTFTANGHDMGSEIEVSSGDTVELRAGASLNPDFGQLERLDLIRFGQVVASTGLSAAEELELRHEVDVSESGWYVLHAVAGKPGYDGYIGAMTAPIYVVVDGGRTWNRPAVPQIAGGLIGRLEAVKNKSLSSVIESEAWQSMPVWAEEFETQLDKARTDIEAVQEKLRELVREASG